MDRKRTPRVLEKARSTDVSFVWLSCNLHLDHKTLWRFIDRTRHLMRDLFKGIVQVAKEARNDRRAVSISRSRDRRSAACDARSEL
jgi:hypothetical protein